MAPAPTKAAVRKSRGGPPPAMAARPISAAPMSPPELPNQVTPPLCPGRTRRHVSRSRGGRGLKLPSAVAQVSPPAAASPTVASHNPRPGVRNSISAPSAANPPLAKTWRAFRISRSSGPSPPRAAMARRETTVLETKKVPRTPRPAQPSEVRTAVPTMMAAIAPSAERALSRQAATATPQEIVAAMPNCIAESNSPWSVALSTLSCPPSMVLSAQP